MTARLLLPSLVLLAACGQQPSQPDNAAAGPPKESGYIAKVKALPAGQREGVLFRAIQKSGGQACQGVTEVQDMAPTPAGQPVWRVICVDRTPWRVSLADDGTAFVTGVPQAGR